MKHKSGNKKKSRQGAPKSRKELRKQKRKEKKARKHEFFQRKKKEAGKHVKVDSDKKEPPPKKAKESREVSKEDKKQRQQAKQKLLEMQMRKTRQLQLQQANEEEDKTIKKLEKQLKLNKHKRKCIPKAFASDGLDYLLEICDEDKAKQAASVEQSLYESASDLEEDFAFATGRKRTTEIENEGEDLSKDEGIEEEEEEEEEEDDDFDDDEDVEGSGVSEEDVTESADKCDDKTVKKVRFNLSSNEPHEQGRKQKRKQEGNVQEDFLKRKKLRSLKEEDEDDEDGDLNGCNPGQFVRLKTSGVGHSEDNDADMLSDEASSLSNEEGRGEFWEDIYGRTRDKEGNVVQTLAGKYVPPQLRAQAASGDARKQEELQRLRKQVKGLVNRLAENNMNTIAMQLDGLYMNNSRNDMNETLTSLLLESLVAPVLTPERLVMEHIMLVAVLHANVGTEVGAHFLQTVVKRYAQQSKEQQEVENKELDNLILVISHLYNFRVFHSQLLYDILQKLADVFGPKEVELILLVLRSVGFSLRKDDPIALKGLVLQLQQKASAASQLHKDSRVQFMLDILLAIKNNNMSKIPNYDPSHSEHLKKVIKGFLRKGNYVTELKISLEDLLKVEERGRWWVVGSAWTGKPGEDKKEAEEEATRDASQSYSQQLLDLARKQRMNTDMRRNIFCILMTAEDYLDAFEKLLHLGLKNQQEREIIHVILDCCLQEKQFNPYYAFLMCKFCQFDRKYQMSLQYALWDRFKELHSLASNQTHNLAKLLVHLFAEKGLPISVLKVIHFTEMDKGLVRLLRQVLLGVLLHKSVEVMREVFHRVAVGPKLHLFRESVRLFIQHFLLQKAESLPTQDMDVLKERANIADAILSTSTSHVSSSYINS